MVEGIEAAKVGSMLSHVRVEGQSAWHGSLSNPKGMVEVVEAARKGALLTDGRVDGVAAKSGTEGEGGRGRVLGRQQQQGKARR